MARGRMIASTVATDKRFNSLSSEAGLVYLMTIPHLDRDGLILGDAMPLWGRVCPRRTEYMPIMDELIAEWVKAGLVLAYECEEGRVLYFLGFGKNQTGMRYDREAPSIYPPPPDYIRTSTGIEKAKSGACSELVRSDDGLTPPQSKVNKTKVIESVADDDGWSLVVDSYQHEIGIITQSIGEEMRAYHDEMGTTLVVDAIKEASRNSVRKWSYIDSILKKWRANGRGTPKGFVDNAWTQLNSAPDYMRDE